MWCDELLSCCMLLCCFGCFLSQGINLCLHLKVDSVHLVIGNSHWLSDLVFSSDSYSHSHIPALFDGMSCLCQKIRHVRSAASTAHGVWLIIWIALFWSQCVHHISENLFHLSCIHARIVFVDRVCRPVVFGDGCLLVFCILLNRCSHLHIHGVT